jgi:outer membrane protein assembly factor BamB
VTGSRRRFLGALAGAAALAGCGYRPGGGDPRWESTVLRDLSVPSTYVRAGDALVGVFASVTEFDFDAETWSSGGRAVAVSLADGTERWRHGTDREFTRGAAAGDGRVVLGHDGPGVVSLADGRADWARSTEGPVTAATHGGGTVFVATRRARLAAVDAASGDPLWRGPLDGAAAFTGTLVADDAGAYLSSPATGLRAVAPDGTERWRRPDAAPGAGATPPLAVVDGTVYAAADGTLRAVSTADGRVRWSRSVPGAPTGRPRVADGRVYHTATGALTCLSAADGEPLWTVSPDAGGRYGDRFSTGAAPGGGSVAVGVGDRLAGFDPEGGARRWRVGERTTVVRVAATADGPVAVLADGTLSARHG